MPSKILVPVLQVLFRDVKRGSTYELRCPTALPQVVLSLTLFRSGSTAAVKCYSVKTDKSCYIKVVSNYRGRSCSAVDVDCFAVNVEAVLL